MECTPKVLQFVLGDDDDDEQTPIVVTGAGSGVDAQDSLKVEDGRDPGAPRMPKRRRIREPPRTVTIRLVELIEDLERAEEDSAKHYGLFLWPSALVLARFVAFHHERLLRGRAVLELGCGTALPGILAALCGAPRRVLLSDRSDARDVPRNVRANLRLNGLGDLARFVPLDWGDLGLIDHLEDLREVDVILAADCFYHSQDFERVIATVAMIFRCNPQCRLYATYHLRSINRTIAPLLARWGMTARVLRNEAFGGDDVDGAESVFLYEIAPIGHPTDHARVT